MRKYEARDDGEKPSLMTRPIVPSLSLIKSPTFTDHLVTAHCDKISPSQQFSLFFTDHLDLIKMWCQNMRCFSFTAPHLPHRILSVIRCLNDDTIMPGILICKTSLILILNPYHITDFHSNPSQLHFPSTQALQLTRRNLARQTTPQ